MTKKNKNKLSDTNILSWVLLNTGKASGATNGVRNIFPKWLKQLMNFYLILLNH